MKKYDRKVIPIFVFLFDPPTQVRCHLKNRVLQNYRRLPST